MFRYFLLLSNASFDKKHLIQMSTVSATTHRFAGTATFDSGAKNQAGNAAATGSAAENTGGCTVGACATFTGTGFGLVFTCGFVGRGVSGVRDKGSGATGTGSFQPITRSHAGGEVPAVFSWVPAAAALVPCPPGSGKWRCDGCFSSRNLWKSHSHPRFIRISTKSSPAGELRLGTA